MAFFGMDSSEVENVPEGFSCKETECLICEKGQDKRVHCLFHQFRAGDVVFLKKFTPQTGLVVLAAGVVAPGSLIEDKVKTCAHVQWAWSGEKHLVEPEDLDDARGNSIYEEFDLAIQREIMELLPNSKDDPFSMVMATSPS
jgi:hypothetical protein